MNVHLEPYEHVLPLISYVQDAVLGTGPQLTTQLRH